MFHPPKPLDREAILQKFMNTVSVEREGLTYVIDVTVKSGNAEKAAKLANAVVEHYIANTAAQQATATTGVTTALNGKIAALQDDVSKAELAVANFKQQNGIFDDTTGGTLHSQVDQLATQVLAAQDALNQAQSKVDQATAAGTSAAGLSKLSEIAVSTNADQLRNDYNAKAGALASAQSLYGPKHPNVITAQAELSKVEGLMTREATRITQQLRADRDLAKTNLAKLQANLDALRQSTGKSDVAAVELRQLERQSDAARAVLSDFMQRSQETSQMQGLQSSQVHVISQAAPPADPTWPKPTLLLPVAAILGLLLGAGAAMMLGDPAPDFAPRPTPAPVDPTRSRAEPAKPNRSSDKIRPARRFAGLDSARRELFGNQDTPLTFAVQRLLRRALVALPQHPKPFVLTISSLDDPDLASTGAALVALGLERIGGNVLVVDPRKPAEFADDYSFILVDAAHDLARDADLEIFIARPEEASLPALANQLVLVVDEPSTTSRPRVVVSNEVAGPAQAAG